MELQHAMAREGVEPNQVTRQLLSSVGRGGSAAVADCRWARLRSAPLWPLPAR